MARQYDYNVPFQRRLVAAAWKDGKLLRDREVVSPAFLTDEVLAGVLRTLQELQDATGNVPDMPAVVEAVRSQVAPGRKWSEYANEAKRIWGFTKGDLAHYAGAAVDFARRTAVGEAVEEAHRLVQDGNVDEIEGLIRRALRVGSSSSSTVDYLATAAERFQSYAEDAARGARDRVATGFGPLDEALRGGVESGELCCLLGITGTGKSHTLTSIGVHALLTGKSVLHVSLENSLAQVQQRYDCRITGWPVHLIAKKPKGFAWKFEKLNSQLKSKLHVQFYPTQTLTCGKLEALIESTDPRPRVVLVDYGALLASPSKAEELRHRLYATFEALRGMAGRTGTAIWTASQANFDGLGSRLLGPEHSSECRTLVQILDLGVSLNVDPTKPALATLYVFKSRRGRDGFEIPCEISWDTSKIVALSDGNSGSSP